MHEPACMNPPALGRCTHRPHCCVKATLLHQGEALLLVQNPAAGSCCCEPLGHAVVRPAAATDQDSPRTHRLAPRRCRPARVENPCLCQSQNQQRYMKQHPAEAWALTGAQSNSRAVATTWLSGESCYDNHEASNRVCGLTPNI